MTDPTGRMDVRSGILVVVMALAVAWAIDDARWVLGRPALTDFLLPAAAMSALLGLAMGWMGWPRWRSHLVGALVASVILAVVAGSQLVANAAPGVAFAASAQSLAGAIRDLIVERRGVTDEFGHFMLALGVVVWSIGQFLGYGVAGHRQPLSVALVGGSVLFATIALTVRDLLGVLVVYSVATLGLLAREAAQDRAIGAFGAGLGARPLRGAALFIVLAVAASLGLSNVAASAPLASAWSGLDGRLVEFGQALRGYLPAGGGTRLGGVLFADSAIVTGSWVSDDTIVARVRVAEADHPYWRAVTYDRYTGSGWTWTGRRDSEHSAGEDLALSVNDGWADGLATRQLIVDVEPIDPGLRTVLSPGPAVRVDQPIRRKIGGEPPAEFVGRVDLVSSAGRYRVTATVPVTDPTAPGALTANRLRAAGDRYPSGFHVRYTEILPGTVSPEVSALLDQIRESSQATNAYDLARAVESHLKDGRNFTYDADVTDVDCRGLGVVDCFVAVSRRGYCEHYASTMVMLLRLAGVPARLVEGFLPGERDPAGIETIRRNQAHAWVEVFFPGSGWVAFDPTGGGIGGDVALPAGPATSPAPSAAMTPRDESDARDPRIQEPADGGRVSLPGSSFPAGPVILGSVLLVGAVLLLARRRRVGAADPPDVVYRRLVAWAGRLGIRRRPSQTPFEFSDLLALTVPSVRDDLRLVTAAAVEALYAPRGPVTGAGQIRRAARRLRLGLLRLPLLGLARRL